ncbi:hypothetical protein Q8F57_039630 [Paraburkholderia terrae]|uniref:hypothetical protein n=1 Tax=Paraburkholderia terrae TaxID=311230 RepID=UPI00296B46D6|nr:hypothetical protein [Paraburkholderia terrae]MDW3658696.1 hypothetical protein [Paraburkholderia terrae]
MPSMIVRVGGLQENIDLLYPRFGRIADAFAPFGITLTAERAEPLDSDPEYSGSWTALKAKLQAQSKAESVLHLLLTNGVPGGHVTVNGQLRDPEFRSIASVYLGASLFWQNGNPSTNIDSVIQVCIHEIGHLFNLVHGDANSSDYSSAMRQATTRDDQVPAVSWAAAVAEAAQLREPRLTIPDPAIYYPFSSACRAHLREASTNSFWLPFRDNFRDVSGEIDEVGDELIEMNIAPGDRHSRIHVGGEIYFTLSIRNRGRKATRIPYDIGPEYGSLKVHLEIPDGGRAIYRPAHYYCSSATTTLSPGERLFRSFALSGPFTDHLVPGTQTCVVRLIDPATRDGAMLGSAKFDVRASEEPQLAKKSAKLRRYAAGEPKFASYSKDIRSVPENSALAAHLALEYAIRLRDKKRCLELLRGCQQPKIPRAIRHAAARHEYVQRVNSGEDDATILKDLRRRFRSSRDQELWERVASIQESMSRSVGESQS